MNRTIAIVVAAAVSATLGYAAPKNPTTTTLSIAPNSPIQLGTPVTLTARVNPITVTGTVTFYNGLRIIGTVQLSGSTGIATFTALDFQPTPAGQPYSLTAGYDGDSSNATSVSSAVNLAVTAVQSTVFLPAAFTPPVVSNAGAPARTLQADFNQDGIMDFAIYGPTGIVIALGNGPNGGPGDGTFRLVNSGAIVTGSGSCIDLATTDFDADGNPDLVCYLRSMTASQVFLGNGDGTFQNPTTLAVDSASLGNATGLPFASTIGVGDFNGDGLVDFAVPVQLLLTCQINVGGVIENGPCWTSSVDVYLGKGDGTFQPRASSLVLNPTFGALTGGYALGMVTGDFNKDGKLDALVVAFNSSGFFDMYYLSGLGTGAFQTPAGPLGAPGLIPTPRYLQLMRGDFAGNGSTQVLYRDGNGAIRVATPSVSGSNVTFTFPGTTPPNAKAPTGFLTMSDFDGDGKLDIAGDFQGTDKFEIMYGNGDGTFKTNSIPQVANCGSDSFPVSFDYNGDHRADLAAMCSSNTLTVLVGGPPPSITQVSPPSAAAGGTGVTLTLTGVSFRSGDTVTWTPSGGAASIGIPTTYNQNGKLTVSLTGALATTLLAAQGNVTLDVVDPIGVSSNSAQVNFAVAPPPAITGLTPASTAAGSATVSLAITGNNFVSGDCVTWTQVTPQAAAPVSLTGTPPCSSTANSLGGQQQLIVQVPTSLLSLVGTANILVIDPDGAPAQTPQTFSILGPTISGLADSTGAVLNSVGTASGDFSLVVNGTNFVSGSSPSTGSVVVFTDPGGAAHVLTPTNVSSNSLTVTVPGANIGSIANTTAKVQVLNQAVGGTCSAPGVTGACSPQLSLSVGAPRITSVSPTAAVTGGGDIPITVSGANFVANSQLVWCNNCNGTPQQSILPTSVSPGQMAVTIPGSLLKAAGTAQISVTNTPGALTNTNTNSPAIPFPISTLGISSLTPTAVIAGSPAFTLTIDGQNSNFDNGAQVLFGNNLPPIFPAQQAGATITSNQIIITVPASYIATSGSLSIQVQDSNGTQTPAVQLPINVFGITNVTPLNLVAGSPDTILTISGTGFGPVNAMQVQWLQGTTTTTLPILSNAAGQVSVKVSGGSQGLLAQPGSAQIIAVQTIAGGTITTSYAQPVTVSGPVVGSLSPTSAAVNGNAFLLTVTGSNFLTSSVVQWTDSTGKTTSLNTNYTSSTVLTAFVPASPLLTVASAQTALVTVTNGTVSSNGVVFQIGSVPTILTNGTGLALCTTISNCQPASSVTAGTGVTTLQVNGTNYQAGSVVIWNANGASTNLVTSAQSSTVLVAIIPASLLVSPAAALITVQDPGPPATTSNGVLFTVATGATPTLSTVAAVGNVILGSPIQLALTGSNFASGAQVQWNNGSSTVGLATVFVDATDLTALVPANLVTAPATVSVTVQSAGSTSNVKPFTIPPISITSLTPSSAATGTGPLILTVNGGNFTSSSAVQWSGGSGPIALTTTFVSPAQLTAILPSAQLLTPGTAFVSVTNGTLTTNALPFTVTASASSAPTIFTDGTGLAICPGGANCTAGSSVVASAASFVLQVAGLNYQPNSVVVWTTGGTATNLTTSYLFPSGQNSNATLQASVPAALLTTPSSALITVQNPDKTVSNGVLFTIGTGATPTLTTVTAVGPVTLGNPIQLAITGTNFAAGALVQWNNGTTVTGLSTSFIDSTDLNATVPANLVTAPSTVQISVQSGGSTSAPKQFTIPSITITSLSTNTVTAGSAALQLSVNGGNFNATSVVQWSNGSTPTPLATTMVSSTQLSALVPASLLANAGTAFVNVATGTLLSNTLPLTIQSPNPPAITTLNINSVQAGASGVQLTVIGSNFINGALAQWSAGGSPQPLTTAFISSTQLTVLIPATLIANPGTAFIGVQNPNGGGTSNLVAFTINAVAGPSINATNGLAPAAAAAGSLTITLTVTGTNFVNGAVVQWNAGTLTPLATGFVSSTQLVALVPANLLTLPATALVQVQNPDKTVSNALPFAVTGSAPITTPTLTSIAPATAAAGSGTLQLTVTGQNFVAASGTVAGTLVQWNGTALPTSFVGTTQLTATVDASLLQGIGANFVAVATGASTSGGVKFQVNGPTLVSIAPASVTAGGPAFNLVLTGTNFVTGSVAVWNNNNLNTTVNSGTQLTTEVPAGLIASAGAAFLLVTNPGGSSTGPQILTITTPPASSIASLAPASAIAGGSAFQLVVAGSGFVSGSTVMWNGSPLATGFVSATQITALIDATLIASAGSANVAVQNPNAPLSASVKFTINGPTVTTLTPATANVGDPGFTLTVAGTNFVPGASVLWNGTALPTIYGSTTQLQGLVATSLLASSGTATVTVQNPGGAGSGIIVFTIGPPSLKITTASLPDGVVGTSYSQILAAQGGTLPYTWSLSAGALPGGLALDPASGTLSGTPTGAANGTIGFTVVDSVGRIAKQSILLNVALALNITTTSPLPMATAGSAYSATLVAAGGTPSYLWSLAGTLPPGLVFNVATGRISGVPTAPGTYAFTIGVTDSRQQQNATANFTLPVTVAALNVSGLTATVAPAQQLPLTVSVPTAYSVDLNGSLTLAFASAVGGDDPSVQFSTVGRTVTFTIPAGTTTAVYPQNAQLLVGSGTLAGTITIKATLQSAGSDITPSTQTPLSAAIPKQAPVVTSATLKQASGGVVISFSAYTTTREATQATLVFNAASGGTLTGGTVTVPLTATVGSWFQSAGSAAFGGQFTVSLPISVSGNISAIGSVTVTVTNTLGTSGQVIAQLQ